jgi:hypothetical protein
MKNMSKKPKRRTRTQAYEDALVNIMKLRGLCWGGSRKRYDPQQVAAEVIRRFNPKLFEELDGLSFQMVHVRQDFSVVIRKPLKRTIPHARNRA